MTVLVLNNWALFFFFFYFSEKIWLDIASELSANTRQSAQWGTYTPDQSYRHFLKSTNYVALTLEMAVVCYML